MEQVDKQLTIETYNQREQKLKEYLQRWIHYGKEPELNEISISDPNCTLRIWTYAEEEKTIGYSMLRKPKNNSRYTFNDEQKVSLSLLLERLEIPFDLEGQQNLFDQQGTHVYKNWLFNKITGRLKKLKLLKATKSKIIYLNNTSGDITYSFLTPKQLELDRRDRPQLHLRDSITLGAAESEKFPPVLQDLTHKVMWDYVFDQTLDSDSAEVFLGSFPALEASENLNKRYRTVLFKGDTIEVAWESSIEEENGNGKFTSLEKIILEKSEVEDLLKRAEGPWHYPRIISAPTKNRDLVHFLFSGLDGFNAWHPDRAKIHPFYLLR